MDKLDQAYRQVRIARVAYRLNPNAETGAALSKAKDEECCALLAHWLSHPEDDPANNRVVYVMP